MFPAPPCPIPILPVHFSIAWFAPCAPLGGVGRYFVPSGERSRLSATVGAFFGKRRFSLVFRGFMPVLEREESRSGYGAVIANLDRITILSGLFWIFCILRF